VVPAGDATRHENLIEHGTGIDLTDERRRLFGALTARASSAAIRLQRRASLATSQPLSEIAYACGFRDYTHFARKFRHRFGYSPGAATHRSEFRAAGRDGRGRHFGHRSRRDQRNLCGNWQALAKAADRHHCLEAAGVNGTLSPILKETRIALYP
jgi:Helix-turn-helix domain